MAGKFLPFIVLTMVWIMLGSTMAQRSSYGEACNETLKCDRRSWLTCLEEQCDCLKPDTMLYDPLTSTCVVRAGEVCKFILGKSDGSNPVYEVACVQNSTCGAKGFCACDPKFYEVSNGTCHPAQGHLQSCSSDLQCSRHAALTCRQGLCQCDPTNSVYSSRLTQCVGLAGHSCIDSKCTDYATCSRLGNVCTCAEEYFMNENGQCLAKLSIKEKCEDNSQCSVFQGSQLTCVNGQCGCNPVNSRYGTAKQHEHDYYQHNDFTTFRSFSSTDYTQCLGKAGSPCLNKLCVPGAFCSYYKQNSNYPEVCKCRDGYTLSRSGEKCGRGHGESCEGEDNCNDGLMCKNRKCSCPFGSQSYDTTSKLCTSKMGGPCDRKNGTGCGAFADCIFSNDLDDSGHCECKPGFLESGDRSCHVAHGFECGRYEHKGGVVYVFVPPCDVTASLICIENKCTCPDFQWYDQKLRKCVGLAGAPCQPLDLDKGACVENSTCLKRPFRGSPRCICNEGMVETDEYTCQPQVKEVTEEQKRIELYELLTRPSLNGTKVTSVATTTTTTAPEMADGVN